jgi:hypothetical protein
MHPAIKMTNDEIDAIFADEFRSIFDLDIWKVSEASGVSFTNDTIDQFKTARKTQWNKPGYLEEGTTEMGGLPYIKIEDCQAIKGQPKTTILVVDFGDVRLCYQ